MSVFRSVAFGTSLEVPCAWWLCRFVFTCWFLKKLLVGRVVAGNSEDVWSGFFRCDMSRVVGGWGGLPLVGPPTHQRILNSKPKNSWSQIKLLTDSTVKKYDDLYMAGTFLSHIIYPIPCAIFFWQLCGSPCLKSLLFSYLMWSLNDRRAILGGGSNVMHLFACHFQCKNWMNG